MRHDTELIPLEALTRVDKPRLSQTLPIRKGKKWWERDPNAAPREDADVRVMATSGWRGCLLCTAPLRSDARYDVTFRVCLLHDFVFSAPA